MRRGGEGGGERRRKERGRDLLSPGSSGVVT